MLSNLDSDQARPLIREMDARSSRLPCTPDNQPQKTSLCPECDTPLMIQAEGKDRALRR